MFLGRHERETRVVHLLTVCCMYVSGLWNLLFVWACTTTCSTAATARPTLCDALRARVHLRALPLDVRAQVCHVFVSVLGSILYLYDCLCLCMLYTPVLLPLFSTLPLLASEISPHIFQVVHAYGAVTQYKQPRGQEALTYTQDRRGPLSRLSRIASQGRTGSPP